MDGSVLFNQTWHEYARGFGNSSGYYWLGLEKLHLLTDDPRTFRLQIILTSERNLTEWAEYRHFSVGSKLSNYILKLKQIRGNTTSDCLGSSNQIKFTTWDRDNGLLLEGVEAAGV